MHVNHQIYRGYNQTENNKKYYDYYDDDKYYSKYIQKNTHSNEKYKKDRHKKRESSSTQDDFDRYSYTTKVSHKSMWGSKTYVSKNSKESNNRLKTKKTTKKLSDTTYYQNKDKKEIKHTKKLKRILKCLIQFNKSRRELYGKYFDIWYDKTFYYYDKDMYNKKSNNNKYESENKYNYKYNDYDDYKNYDKNLKNKFDPNIVPKREKKERSTKTNYYLTYSIINDYDRDNGYYSQKKSKNKNVDNEYKEYYSNSNTSNNKVKYKKEVSSSSKKKKDDKYYSDSYYEEYDRKKVSPYKKKSKKFSRKLLYILNKYMIERKEKSQCFNKWIDFITSIYLYNGEGAYNDLGGKSQTKSYNDKTSITNNDYEKSNKDYDNYNYSKKKNNDKYNQKDNYRIEKYYEDYEETPDKRDSIEENTENHTYIYNNQNKNYSTNEKNEIFMHENNYDKYYDNENNDKYYTVKDKTEEGPNKIVTYTSYRKEPKVSKNKYYKYEKQIIEDPLETEERIINTKIKSNQLYKLEDFNAIDDKIIKEMKPSAIRNENGYKVLEFTKTLPEKTVVSHKKETKIKVLGRNNANNKSMKELNNNEYIVKGTEFFNVEEFDSPLRENNSLVTMKNKKSNQINNLKLNNYNSNTYNKSINSTSENIKSKIKESNNSFESKKSKKSKNSKNKHNDKKKKILTKLLKKDKYKYINLLNNFEKWIDFAFYNKNYIQNNNTRVSNNNKNINKKQNNNNNKFKNIQININEDNQFDNKQYLESEYNKISAYEDDNPLKIGKKYPITRNKNNHYLNNKMKTDYWKTDIKEPSFSDNEYKSQKSLNKVKNKKEIFIRNIFSNNRKELIEDSDKKLPNENYIKIEKRNNTQESFEEKNLNQKIPGRNRDNELKKNKNSKNNKNNTYDDILAFKTPEKLTNNLVNYLPNYMNPENFRTIDNSKDTTERENYILNRNEINNDNDNEEQNYNEEPIYNEINLDNLTKKERRQYKKLRKAMHLLRKAIRTYKKRKKKGLIKISDEDLKLNHFIKWRNSTFSYDINEFRSSRDNLFLDDILRKGEDENSNSFTVAKELLRIKKLKKIIKVIDKKYKNLREQKDFEEKLTYLRKWYDAVFSSSDIFPQVTIPPREFKRKKMDKPIILLNNPKVFQKKNISRKKNNKQRYDLENTLTNNSKVINNTFENIDSENTYNQISENSMPELNKKIKFSINDDREKNQIIVFNNFNIKDINGRKEIIINKTILPKNNNVSNTNNNINYNYNKKLNNNQGLINQNKKPLINSNVLYQSKKNSNTNHEALLDKNINSNSPIKSQNKIEFRITTRKLNKKEIEILKKLFTKMDLLLIKYKYFDPWRQKSKNIKNKQKSLMPINQEEIHKNSILKKNGRRERKKVNSLDMNDPNKKIYRDDRDSSENSINHIYIKNNPIIKQKIKFSEEYAKDDSKNFDTSNNNSELIQKSFSLKANNNKKKKKKYPSNSLKKTIIANELKNLGSKNFLIPINPKTKIEKKPIIIEDIIENIANNVKYVNREMRSNSRKIIIKQDPLDDSEEENLINKSYSKNEMSKFNFSETKKEAMAKNIKNKIRLNGLKNGVNNNQTISPNKNQKINTNNVININNNIKKDEIKLSYNNKTKGEKKEEKKEIKREEQKKEEKDEEEEEEKEIKKGEEKEKAIEIKNNEITRIKAPKIPNSEISNDEESSAQLEDVSEVNTIYSMRNNPNQISGSGNINMNTKKSNIDADNVIVEVDDFSKKIVKGSVYNLTKDKILLPYIYKLSLNNNNAVNKTLNVLKNCNGKLFKMINSEDYARVLERNQKNIAAYQIYCLFSFFNNGKDFYKMKYAFNKWKKFINIFNQLTKIKHIKNYRGHCIGCDCEDLHQCHISYCCCENEEENSKCSNYSLCFNCSCKLCKIILKKILIRHKIMKIVNPKRYHLYLWYKHIFNRSRIINL